MGSAESQSVVLSKEMGSSAPFHIFDILLSLAPYTKQVHEPDNHRDLSFTGCSWTGQGMYDNYTS
jgi:hypothetical protein